MKMELWECIKKQGIFEHHDFYYIKVSDEGVTFYNDKECKNIMINSNQDIISEEMGDVWKEVKEEFPKVFKTPTKTFRVQEHGGINIHETSDNHTSIFSQGTSLEVLYEAVKESKRIRGLE